MNGRRAKAARKRTASAPAVRTFPELEAILDAGTQLEAARARKEMALRRAHSGVDRPAVHAAKAKRERRQARNLARR